MAKLLFSPINSMMNEICFLNPATDDIKEVDLDEFFTLFSSSEFLIKNREILDERTIYPELEFDVKR